MRWEKENESEDESEDEESEEAWCEAGEHSVPKGMMWPGFTDCFDCATPKEYAEHMNISKKAAEAIARGEEKPMCLECEENSPLPVSSRTRSRTQATHAKDGVVWPSSACRPRRSRSPSPKPTTRRGFGLIHGSPPWSE